ncbi:MAG TPA: glycosyltransferase [Tepidisphaeraceae bacterium]|jgi:predicted O-linked N-acetylglucosamine transferase (SPINDLY family)
MASLLELVDRVNKGETIDASALEIYQESANSAEKFLAHHAHAMLDLRRAQQHILQSLEAIDYADQKVLSEFISIAGFLNLTDQRAQPIVKFGASAINRREYALGIEAIASAVAYDLANNGAFTADKENSQWIANQYQRAAQCIGWTSGQDLNWSNKQTRIALIVSSIADDEATGRMIRGLAKFIDPQRYKLFVYSTEAFVRREKQQFQLTSYLQPSSKRGGKTLDALERHKVTAWIAPVEGDAVTAAQELADQMIKDKIDVALFDATQSDPIAALVTTWETAPAKVNLVRRTPMFTSSVNCVMYLDQARYEADAELWRRKSIESTYLLEGIDLAECACAAPSRSAYGIPEQSLVLASVSPELDKTISEEFTEMVINVLRANPNAIYLAIGDGELALQKRKFESAGVGKRIGYAGKRRDLPGFLRIADIYLAEFPSSNAAGVLQAMAVERPVVAMKWGNDAAQSQSAILAGGEAAISSRDIKAYTDKVNALVRDPAQRRSAGRAMKARVEQLFGMSQTARHLEQLCDQLIQRKLATAEAETIIKEDQPMTAVA